MEEKTVLEFAGLKLTVPYSALALIYWDGGSNYRCKRALLEAVSSLDLKRAEFCGDLAISGMDAARVIAKTVAILEADNRSNTIAASQEKVAMLELEAARERAEAIRAKGRL